jgi:CelD/BcsL family acetyltransferase involved in cellulose biosynthesis
MTSCSSYCFEELNDSNATDWQMLNRASPDGTFFHTLEWKKTLEQAVGYKSRYFLVFEDDRPVALCPFYEQTIRGFRGLVSLPEATLNPYNHIIIMRKEEQEISQLLHKSREIVHRCGLSSGALGITEDHVDHFVKLNVPLHPLGGNMVLDLQRNDPETIWNSKFEHKERQKIRRLERHGFGFDDTLSLEALDIFHELYRANLERKGVTPHPLSYFRHIFDSYGKSGQMMLTLLRRNDEAAAGLLCLLYPSRQTMYCRYLALNRQLGKEIYTPTYGIYWKTILRAHELGYRIVDFGTSVPEYTNGDQVQASSRRRTFKEKFGCAYKKKYHAILPVSVTFKAAYTVQNWTERIARFLRPTIAREANSGRGDISRPISNDSASAVRGLTGSAVRFLVYSLRV